MSKKNLFIIIGIIFIIIILIVVYILSKSQKKEVTFNKNDDLVIKQINTKSIVFDDNQNSFKYINYSKDKIIELHLDKTQEREIYTVENNEKIYEVIWAKDRTKCLVLSGDDQTRYYKYLDLDLDLVKTLNSEISNPVFSPDGKSIAYWYKRSNKNSISIANPDGTNWKAIYQFDSPIDEFESIKVHWILDGYIHYNIISESESVYSDLYEINISEKDLKPQRILNGYSAIFEDKYQKLLVDINDNLQIYDLKTQNNKNISKRLYYLSSYYYISNSNILVVANESLKGTYSNNLYIIDLDSGKADLVYSFKDNEDLKSKNIIYSFYSKDSKIIYFVIGESLYKIEINLSKYLK